MGRGRSGGGGARPSQRAAPATTAPRQQPAANTPARQQTQPATKPGQPAQQAPHQPGAPAPQQGMGMLGMMGSMAAGSVLGNVISDKMLGGNESQAPQQQQMAGMEQQNPCSQFKWMFDSCLSQNQTSISQCQFNFDQYRQCMANPQAMANPNTNQWTA